MKLKFKISISLLLTINVALSQDTLNCTEISKLINFKEVLNFFDIANTTDSLFIIDKHSRISNQCGVIKWAANSVRITHDTLLIEKSITGATAIYFTGLCQYYVIDQILNKNKHFEFTIIHACTNEFANCKVLKKRNKYRLVKFTAGVY